MANNSQVLLHRCRIASVLFGITVMNPLTPYLLVHRVLNHSGHWAFVVCFHRNQTRKGAFTFSDERICILSAPCWAPYSWLQWHAGFAGPIRLYNHQGVGFGAYEREQPLTWYLKDGFGLLVCSGASVHEPLSQHAVWLIPPWGDLALIAPLRSIKVSPPQCH